MAVLVTGVAGFIGYHVSEALLTRGEHVIGVDIVNEYYDVALKEARLARLTPKDGFDFHRIDLSDRGALARTMVDHDDVDRIVHILERTNGRKDLTLPSSIKILCIDHLGPLIPPAAIKQQAAEH